MKIIQLIQKPQRRGAELFATQLGNELLELGHEVVLVSIFKGDGQLDFKGEWVKLDLKSPKSLYYPRNLARLANLIKSFDADIVQANASDTLKFAVLSKKLVGWKAKLIFRNANQIGDFIQSKPQHRFNQFLINQLDAVASVSNASKENFLQTFNFPSEKVCVLPIGINPMEIDAKLHEEMENTINGEYLLALGGLVPEKDPLGMLVIFFRLAKKYPAINLVFVGSGELKSILQDQIIILDLESRVFIYSNQSNIFPILSKAKALVMPSKIEGLPGVILEAMYCQVPVVAFGVGGIPGILVNKETGWCVNPGDLESFSGALEEILKMDQFDLDQITTNAKALVLNSYQIDQIAKEFKSFYQIVKAKV